MIKIFQIKMHYSYKTISKVGQIREENEDSIGVYEIDKGLLIIVCDGLGGNNAGEVASRLAVETVYNHFKNSNDENYSDKIKAAITEANKIIYRKALSASKLNGMSTTIEVLFLKNNNAYLGHVGDSRIYLFSDNVLKQLTKDHSLVQKLIDEGVLSHKEAEVHPNKNIITRALGDFAPVEPDIDFIKLEAGKNFLFFACTDGVNAVINNNKLQEIFLLNEIDKISEKISEVVEKGGAPDNFTFAIIKISDKEE